jgi:hypothetical protein
MDGQEEPASFAMGISIDEYRLLVFPVAVGHGKRLFTDDAPATGFTLIDSATTSAGAVYSALTRPPSNLAESRSPAARKWCDCCSPRGTNRPVLAAGSLAGRLSREGMLLAAWRRSVTPCWPARSPPAQHHAPHREAARAQPQAVPSGEAI